MSILSDYDIAKLSLPPSEFHASEFHDFLQTNEKFVPMIVPFIPHQVKTRKTTIHHPNYYRHLDGRLPDVAEMQSLTIPEEVEQKIVSYGLSSAGYDVRLDRQFKIFKNTKCQVIDPLNMSNDYYDDVEDADFCIIPPNGYILGLTMETFNIPRDVMVVCVGKSTLARVGCIVNVTPIEPGWSGKVVIEVANASNVPVKVHAEMGIGQFLFYKMSSPCIVSYDDRKGKYQGQTSLVTAKL